MDTVRFESDPPGAEAKVSNGQTCRTPCAARLLPGQRCLHVTFTLDGYQPETETLELGLDRRRHHRSCGRTRSLRAIDARAAAAEAQKKPVAQETRGQTEAEAAKQAAPPAPSAAAPPAAAPPPAPSPGPRPSRLSLALAQRFAHRQRFVGMPARQTARWTGSVPISMARMPI